MATGLFAWAETGTKLRRRRLLDAPMQCGDIWRQGAMRLGIFLGIILGVLLTIGSAYTYDSVTGRTANAPTASEIAGDQRPMVNWDVVARDFNDVRAGLVEVGNRVQEGWKKLTG
jgi:hypothetical protein